MGIRRVEGAALAAVFSVLTTAPLCGQVQWSTIVDGQSWTPGMQVDVETCDTVQLDDSFVNTSGGPLPVELVQDFNPSQIALLDAMASSGTVTQSPGQVSWSVTIPAGGSASLTIWVHAEPCSWPQSPLQREWLGTGERRDVVLVKWLADLQLSSSYDPLVFSGQQASFTLQYANAGGYENAVQVWCEFPPDATFTGASPPADFVDPPGLGAGWDVGDLANGDGGQIDITVGIAPELPIPTPLVIGCAVHDHTGAVAQQVFIEFETGARVLWERLVNGEPWFAGMVVEGETCDTIEVVEGLGNRSAAAAAVVLVQHFESAEIGYVDAVASSGVVTVFPGRIEWAVDVAAGLGETLVSHLHIDPCSWSESSIAASLSEGDQWRELGVYKAPPLLWLEPSFVPEVVPGEPAEFELAYGNDGGYENDLELWCDFPPEAVFGSSSPPPDFVDPSGLAAGWTLGDLAGGAASSVLVAVQIDASLPPGAELQIVCDLLDHTDVVADTAFIDFVTVDASVIFADGFEAGDTSSWSASVP